MRHLLTTIFIAGAAAIGPLAFASPANDDNTEVDVLDLSISENMATPAVPGKSLGYVKGAMDQLRRYLAKDSLQVDVLRNNDVLQITIPCSDLFGPGSTELKQSAVEVLKPLRMVVREPEKYKILIAVHSDNTGDDIYADSITAARANAIDDLLWELASNQDTNVIPYGLGKDSPLHSNTSMINRALNRRVEIFIVPDRGLFGRK